MVRIALIGQAAFGEAVLKALREAGEEVVGVSAPLEARGGRDDPLKVAAAEVGLPLVDTRSLKTPEGIAHYAQLGADLSVMAFVTVIIPEEVLNRPRLGTIQYHPSLLPRHRGGSAINWAIINGETKTGLTIFWPDAGIDTGPILLQKEVAIDPDDTVGSLYFNQLFSLGVEATVEAVRLVREGKAPRIPQDEAQATYEPLCREEQAHIDWQRPPRHVYNLIRGTNPQPGAWSLLRGQKLKIFDVAFRPSPVVGGPGEVVDVGEDGVAVALEGASLLVKRVQPEGSSKTAASEYAAQVALRPGERFEGQPSTGG
ncbi:MAG: methionyl-tRNA formyltransferase [Dehalococcoidia bacterium]